MQKIHNVVIPCKFPNMCIKDLFTLVITLVGQIFIDSNRIQGVTFRKNQLGFSFDLVYDFKEPKKFIMMDLNIAEETLSTSYAMGEDKNIPVEQVHDMLVKTFGGYQ